MLIYIKHKYIYTQKFYTYRFLSFIGVTQADMPMQHQRFSVFLFSFHLFSEKVVARMDLFCVSISEVCLPLVPQIQRYPRAVLRPTTPNYRLVPFVLVPFNYKISTSRYSATMAIYTLVSNIQWISTVMKNLPGSLVCIFPCKAVKAFLIRLFINSLIYHGFYS